SRAPPQRHPRPRVRRSRVFVTDETAEPFTLLASVYDVIMAEVEYEEWAAFILELLDARGYQGGPLLDLGCGTGNSTAPMADRGLDVAGVDASEAMLAVA